MTEQEAYREGPEEMGEPLEIEVYEPGAGDVQRVRSFEEIVNAFKGLEGDALREAQKKLSPEEWKLYRAGVAEVVEAKEKEQQLRKELGTEIRTTSVSSETKKTSAAMVPLDVGFLGIAKAVELAGHLWEFAEVAGTKLIDTVGSWLGAKKEKE